jgi:hypothetical protein
MSVDWQLILVGLIVAVAMAFLAKSAWQTLRGKARGCGGKCACPRRGAAAQPAESDRLIPSHQLILRRRDPNSP